MFFLIFLRSEEVYVSKWFILLWQLQSKIAVNVPLLSRLCIYKQKRKPSKFIPGFGSPPANTFRCQYSVLHCSHAKVNVKQRCLCQLSDIPQSLLGSVWLQQIETAFFFDIAFDLNFIQRNPAIILKVQYWLRLRFALEFGIQIVPWSALYSNTQVILAKQNIIKNITLW